MATQTRNGPMNGIVVAPTMTLQELHPEWFERKVPISFYETEEELGPLPSEWEKAYKGKQTYFVNHKDKTTTWVDPRTFKTREHDISKIKPGELPYGWDEAVDAEIGVYYIDHNTQTTYLDPPWDEYVRFQVAQLTEFLRSKQEQVNSLQERLKEQRDEKEEKERAEAMRQAELRVQELEKRRAELERELLILRGQSIKDSKDIDDDREDILLADLDDLDERLRLERMLAAGDTDAVAREVALFKQRLAELTAMNERLRTKGNDELADAKAARREMERLRQLLQQEADERAFLEREIMALKGDLEGLDDASSRTKRPPIAVPEPPPLPAIPDVVVDPSGRRRTRYDMEIEVLMLKKRLEAERAEKDRLNALYSSLEGIKDSPNALPEWVRKLQSVASNSKTLRVQIGRKQNQNPDLLSFRERMLFFASGAVEQNIKGNAPPVPAAKPIQPQFAVTPRESKPYLAPVTR